MEIHASPRGTVYVSRFALRHRLLLLAMIPVFLVLIGTVGYHLLEEDYSLFDGLYMTIITLSTTGYMEVHPLSPAGRVFTIFLILCGVFTLLYAAMESIRFIVSGEIENILGRQRMERNLSQLQGHSVVCGYGRMGRLVCQEFSRQNVPFVVIDVRPELLEDFRLPHGIAVLGDATSDEVLRHAGIERARALVTVMASDADNLYTTLSARLLNRDIYIVARAEDVQSEVKLTRAGANRGVSPYVIGGQRLAQAVLRPTVVDFIELASKSEHVELQMEETKISGHSALVGTNLRDSRIRAELKVIIVAVKKPTGEMVFNPDPEMVIESGAVLVAIGSREQLDRLEALANP